MVCEVFMSSSWVVVKFGGTSVSSVSCWKEIKSIAQLHRSAGNKVLVVCSALSGVSDQLTQLGELALCGDHAAALRSLEKKHLEFCHSLSVSAEKIQLYFGDLARRLDGVAMLRELSARSRAEIMAVGERALTVAGSEFLSAALIDATELLQTQEYDDASDMDYLSAVCGASIDKRVLQKLDDLNTPLVVTQGFIASNPKGETVLLGRGGSDVSASYLAAKIGACVCEIWTDVAGVYTANPRLVPQARIIRHLGYDEAQEIAAMGGKVLHPNSLAPLKQANIPLFIKKTTDKERPGTCVSWDVSDVDATIKSISVKKNVLLVSIEGVSMWRSVGFLHDVFSCFKKHGLSVDLMSTSESCITVSLDTAANLLDAESINRLVSDLNVFANASTIGPCAAISLVGSGIRSILSDLSDVFTQFKTHKVYLLSQAASDLNLTFVVDEERADKLCQQLHHILIENQPLGELFSLETDLKPQQNAAWWSDALAKKESISPSQLPGYFYSERVVMSQLQKLLSLTAVDSLYYAIKANPFPGVLQALSQKGVRMECVSQGEIEHVLEHVPAIQAETMLFTPNFAPREEYAYALEKGVWVTLDGDYPLRTWPELFAGKELLLRVDPGQGRGHHKHVMTAGQSAKFGIPPDQLPEVAELAKKAGATIVGLHAHAGSGVLDPTHWSEIASFLGSYAELFPELRIINCGGGLGIAQSPWQEDLDMTAVDSGLVSFKEKYPNMELWMEPGRYLVAESGVLLARVTQVKQKGDKKYVGIETGINSLIRPALYGAYHPMINLTRHGEPLVQEATIVGPICESADIIGHDRLLPETKEGDIIAIGLAGAYGACMSSNYNNREPAAEYVI
jgi:bifunctional diaminopimelate decarboxylase / aspartate kinase